MDLVTALLADSAYKNLRPNQGGRTKRPSGDRSDGGGEIIALAIFAVFFFPLYGPWLLWQWCRRHPAGVLATLAIAVILLIAAIN